VKISKRIFSLTGLLLAATLVLGACTDAAQTATPVPATATVAPTTAPATAAVTTTSGPTTTDIPSITGTTEEQVDSSISAEVAKQLGVQTLAVRLYTSDDDGAVVGDHADAALTAKGYSFGIPNQTKPISQDNGTVGLYSRSGSDDILFTAVPIPANADVSGSIPGIDAASAQKFTDQVKGKKTLLVVMTGPSLLQALVALGQGSGAQTAAAVTTTAGTVAVSTPTVAGTIISKTIQDTTPGDTTTTPSVSAGAASAPVSYAGATSIQLPDVLKGTLLTGLSAAKNATLDGFKSSDVPSAVKSGLQSGYTTGGWTEATAAFTGASDALSQIGPDAFFIAYTKDNKLSFVLGMSGATASALGVTGVDANGTVYIVGNGEK
jgi:hypothetical protein